LETYAGNLFRSIPETGFWENPRKESLPAPESSKRVPHSEIDVAHWLINLLHDLYASILEDQMLYMLRRDIYS
jgi:hypothetical protein